MWRYLLAFSLAYLGGTAIVIWIATAVLCLGDPKFGRGCGGWGLYFLIWALFYLPAAAVAAVAGLTGRLAPRARALVLAACLVLLLAWLLVSWLTGMTDSVGLGGHDLVLIPGCALIRLGVGWLHRRSTPNGVVPERGEA
jgi:hypothetical protein